MGDGHRQRFHQEDGKVIACERKKVLQSEVDKGERICYNKGVEVEVIADGSNCKAHCEGHSFQGSL